MSFQFAFDRSKLKIVRKSLRDFCVGEIFLNIFLLISRGSFDLFSRFEYVFCAAFLCNIAVCT